MSHFPAPWNCEGEFDAEVSVTISAADERVVCDVEPFCEDWTDEEIANARLIAAAPELLECAQAGGRYSDALKKYQDDGKFGVSVTSKELDRLFEDWHDKTHAAIAKAEGRASERERPEAPEDEQAPRRALTTKSDAGNLSA